MPRGREDASLESMPNIGKVVACRLREAGVSAPEDLVRIGSVEAACRLARARPMDPPCRSLLSGLEGAIRGVRWHAIPQEEREALWSAYLRDRGARCGTSSRGGDGRAALGEHLAEHPRKKGT